jgi:hypothetical protein
VGGVQYEIAYQDAGTLRGLAAHQHLLDERSMNASELAHRLDVHASTGSWIHTHERPHAVEHGKRPPVGLAFGPKHLWIDGQHPAV